MSNNITRLLSSNLFPWFNHNYFNTFFMLSLLLAVLLILILDFKLYNSIFSRYHFVPSVTFVRRFGTSISYCLLGDICQCNSFDFKNCVISMFTRSSEEKRVSETTNQISTCNNNWQIPLRKRIKCHLRAWIT